MQIESSIYPLSLARLRKRIGENDVEPMLMTALKARCQHGLLKAASAERATVNTTEKPKAVVYPTDSKLLERSHQHLMKLAEVVDDNYPGRSTATILAG